MQKKVSPAMLAVAALVVTGALAVMATYVRSQSLIGGADVSITITDSPDPVKSGETLTYTALITNNGPEAAVNVRLDSIQDYTIPIKESTLTATGCTMTDTGCVIGTIPSGGTVTVTASGVSYIVADPAISGMHLTVTSDTPDPHTANNDAKEKTSVVLHMADLSVTVTDSADPAKEGQPLTYTITVTNNGPDTAEQAYIAGQPGGLELPLDAMNIVGCTMEFDACWFAESLLAGQSAVATVSGNTIYIPRPDKTGASVLVGSKTADSRMQNNDATERTRVDRLAADLSVTASDSPDPVTIGQTLTYTVKVTNSGPDTAKNVIFTPQNDYDIPIEDVTVIGATCDMNGCKLTSDDLASGETATITAYGPAATTTAAPGIHLLFSSDTFDPHLSNNDLRETTKVLQ